MRTQEHEQVRGQGGTDPAYQEVRLLAERQQLRVQIDALQRQIRQLAASEAAEGGVTGEPGDIAADVAAQETAALVTDELARHLAEIAEALQRLETGSYGRCTGCGGPIEPERLAARPSAARCLRCERMAERHELQGQEPPARDLPSIVAPAGMPAQPGRA